MLVACVVALGAYLVPRAYDPSTINHDVAWYLYAGERLVSGARLGVDIVDTNPPFVFWVSALESGLAQLVRLSPYALHALLTLLLALVASRQFSVTARRGEVHPDLAALLGYGLLTLCVLWPNYAVGQRDHWAVILLMPLLAGAVLPSASERFAWALPSLLAAMGLLLKPHYALCWIGAELAGAVALRDGRRLVRRENVLLVALGCAGVLSMLAAHPQYFAQARTELALYWAYDRPVPRYDAHGLLVLYAAPLTLLAFTRRPIAQLSAVLAVAALCARVATLVQGKNFSYHHVPSDLFALGSIGTLGLSLLHAGALSLGPLGSKGFFVLGSLAAFVCAVLQVRPEETMGHLQRRRERQVELFGPAEGKTTAVFSTDVEVTYPPAILAGAQPLSPYSCLWPLPGLYSRAAARAEHFPYRTLAQMGALERRFVTRLVDQLDPLPEVLVFDQRPVQSGLGRTAFDWRRYLAADPRFSRVLDHYVQHGFEYGVHFYKRRR